MRKTYILAGSIFIVCIAVFVIVQSGGKTPHIPSSNDTDSEKAASILFSSSTRDVSLAVATSSRLTSTPYIVIGTAKLRIGIADTEATRELGLSGRTNLALDEGLFFVTDTPNMLGIWMKDMNFPIDVIWFDNNLKVITIVSNMLPDSYPTVYNPTVPAQYVLEVNAGVASKEGIKVGQKAVLINSSH